MPTRRSLPALAAGLIAAPTAVAASPSSPVTPDEAWKMFFESMPELGKIPVKSQLRVTVSTALWEAMKLYPTFDFNFHTPAGYRKVAEWCLNDDAPAPDTASYFEKQALHLEERGAVASYADWFGWEKLLIFVADQPNFESPDWYSTYFFHSKPGRLFVTVDYEAEDKNDAA